MCVYIGIGDLRFYTQEFKSKMRVTEFFIRMFQRKGEDQGTEFIEKHTGRENNFAETKRI